jgi:hypothetical protein
MIDLKSQLSINFSHLYEKLIYDRSKKLIIDNFINDCCFLNLFQTFDSFFDLSFHNISCKNIL